MGIKLRSLFCVTILGIFLPLFAWGADPKPSRVYSREDIQKMVETKQGVVRSADAFFIDGGKVFRLKEDGSVAYVPQGNKFTKLILYKDLVVSLYGTTVYLLIEEKGGKLNWHDLGSSVVDIETDGVDLFALSYYKTFWKGTEVRGVYVYKGKPGPISWNWMPILIPYSCGQNMTCFMTIMMPYADGHEFAFNDAKIPDAIRFQKENGKLNAVDLSGKIIPLSRNQ